MQILCKNISLFENISSFFEISRSYSYQKCIICHVYEVFWICAKNVQKLQNKRIYAKTVQICKKNWQKLNLLLDGKFVYIFEIL